MPIKLDLLEIKSKNKLGAIQEVGLYFLNKGFKIAHDIDVLRPWGFYFYFDAAQTKKFAEEFFAGVELKGIDTSLPLQPKVLVFEPAEINSWQYHHRRAEIWRVITGSMQAIMAESDEQPAVKIYKFGDVVNFTQGMRHRGGAIEDQWGAVAEIWQHTEPDNPSDEEDIVRLQDNYGRK